MRVKLVTLDKIECEIEIKGARPIIERPIYRHRYGSFGECEEGDGLDFVNPLRTRIYEYKGEKRDDYYIYEEMEIGGEWAEALEELRRIISKAKSRK